ncbi:MAG: S-layer homology domain-containing protein [Lutispora sp.]|nr:S-layer homology domain-containing protein [Lutispora sp.]
MLKMIQKRMTVVLIVSMLLQLFAGATPVLAKDSSDLIADPEFVPMLTVTLSPGETAGATSATVTDYVYGNLLVNITEQEIAMPRIGDTAPTTGDNLFADYKSGADITAGVAAGNYLQIYDVDVEEGEQIVAFYQAELREEDINEEEIEEEYDQDSGEDLEEEPDQNLDEGLEGEIGEDIGEDEEEEPAENQLMGAELMAEGGYTYIDENGDTKFTGTKTVAKITSDTDTLNDGWYIAEGTINIIWTITIKGDAHLILADNSHFSVKGFFDAGINVSEGNSLTIYAQSEGDKMGVMDATGHFYATGIGGKEGNGGSITINGGNIIAKGGSSISAGIGGGLKGSGGDITINNGKVTAIGGTGCAGIGGSSYGDGGIVTIGGGTVIATGGSGGAGIGGGYGGNGGTVIIKNHPTIIATAGEGAADIGNGQNSEGTTVIKRDSINGNDLTYVKLELQNLSPNKTHSIVSNGEEYKIDGKGLTGFFVERSADGRNITIKPEEVSININPGDVQNSKIIINMKDYSDPVAGFGSALNFPLGSRARIDIPLTYDTSIGGIMDFTISMWIFPNENEPYQTLFRQYNTDTFSTGAWLRYIKSNDDEGYLYFGIDSRKNLGGWQWVWNWNNGVPPSNVAKIPFHQWTHVALTKSGKKVTLYANGEKYYEMTLDDIHYYTGKPYSGNISIGGSSIDDQFFCGEMDEIQFWNTPLTSDEIKAWMYREIDKKHPKYNNLFYYYRFNEKGGTSVFDSKELYNGTMVNMTESSYITSDVTGWSVEAGSVLKGELIGSHAKGSSNNGLDWNLTFEIVEQGEKGTATITEDNKFEYQTNDMSQEGHDSFTYRVKGFGGKYSNTEAVNIDIRPKINIYLPPSPDDSDRHEKSRKDDAEKTVDVKPKKADTETTTEKDGKKVISIVIDHKKVEKELEQEGSNAIVTISDTSGADTVIGTLNGQTVRNMERKDAVLEIKTSRATYTLPTTQINIDVVSGQFGKEVELKDIAVSVKISEPAEDTVKIVKDTADKNNYQIIVEPIEFEITCSSGSKTVEVSKFSAYVERMIAIPEGVDPSKITTGVVLNPDGTFSHAPTAIIMIDGKYYAKINSLTNSVYSVIYSPKTFKDVEKHWAKEAVNDMGSRLVISGTGKDNFEPDRNITRAEFAAVMVRALGIRPEVYKNNYFDVKAGELYSEYISTSSYHGLVRGYDDGTFKPDGNITRQEAMTILTRAMDITKLGENLNIDEGDILEVFSDNADVSDWAEDFVSKCIKTGVVTSKGDGRIAPLDNITRAEAAIMVRRLLSKSGLINE